VNHWYEAAFGDRPDLPITALPTEPSHRWLAAVALGGQGRYAAAATVLDPLLRCADPVLAALAAATLASHRRQLGGHGHARILDAAGHARLAAAGLLEAGPRPAEARSDVLLGLAADAVGAARLQEARRLITAANRVPAGWRHEIRTGWVSAEVELMAGDPAAAVRRAEPAADRAAASGSVRHRIKAALVLGAALSARGDRARAVGIVDTALADATDLGLLSLVWPGALIMAGLEPARGASFRRCAAVALQSVLLRADPIGRRLANRSSWVPQLAGPSG